MKSRYYMSETEQEIMEVLWQQSEPVKQSQILSIFEERGKQWKRQTLNTFLSRLEEKGFVVRENRKVKAACKEEEFQKMQMKEFIHKQYDGRWSKFMVAFTENEEIDIEEAEELLRIVEEKVNSLKKK